MRDSIIYHGFEGEMEDLNIVKEQNLRSFNIKLPVIIFLSCGVIGIVIFLSIVLYKQNKNKKSSVE